MAQPAFWHTYGLSIVGSTEDAADLLGTEEACWLGGDLTWWGSTILLTFPPWTLGSAGSHLPVTPVCLVQIWNIFLVPAISELSLTNWKIIFCYIGSWYKLILLYIGCVLRTFYSWSFYTNSFDMVQYLTDYEATYLSTWAFTCGRSERSSSFISSSVFIDVDTMLCTFCLHIFNADKFCWHKVVVTAKEMTS